MASGADAKTVLEDLAVGTGLNTSCSVPLGFVGTLTDQIQRVPDSSSIASDTSLSVPIGVGWADDTSRSVPVSGFADTVVNSIIPVSVSTCAGQTRKTVPVGG